MATQMPAMIQNRMTIVTSAQPSSSKWCCSGLFVAITASVILQVASFKATGRRVFRMAPIHHHFELKGWNEVTIVIRFWIIAGACVGVGLATFYAEWIVGGAL